MSWYRTYRPQTVAGLHSASVRSAFTRILETGSFAHAYLLAGPKGTGKTSGARILAKVLNCDVNASAIRVALTGKSGTKLLEPCGKCALCVSITNGSSLSVVELDAASNRGIDDIREIRDRIGLAPANGRVSVYIIDEVHMLTTEAFNALLKVLEEPPAHVVFILATTDPQKLPGTITSRCTLISYQRAQEEEVVQALQEVAKGENIIVDETVLVQIARRCDGSFRDAVKLLEQIGSSKSSLTLADLDSLSVMFGELEVETFVRSLLARSYEEVSKTFIVCREKNVDSTVFQKQVLLFLLTLVRTADATQRKDILNVLKVIHVPSSPTLPIPSLPFELACLSWCVEDSVVTPPQTAGTRTKPASAHGQVVAPPKKAVVSFAIPTPSRAVTAESLPPQSSIPIEPLVQETTFTGPVPAMHIIEQKWYDILVAVRNHNPSIEALLRSTKPKKIEGDVLHIEAYYQFHKEQLELARNRDVIESVLGALLGCTLKLSLDVVEKAVQAARSKESNVSGAVQDDALVKAAQDVFLN